MTYKLVPKRSNFCECTVEAWVLDGVMCERQTFYGNNSSNVRAQALNWVKQQIARESFLAPSVAPEQDALTNSPTSGGHFGEHCRPSQPDASWRS
jgi:hypothetical protein